MRFVVWCLELRTYYKKKVEKKVSKEKNRQDLCENQTRAFKSKIRHRDHVVAISRNIHITAQQKREGDDDG